MRDTTSKQNKKESLLLGAYANVSDGRFGGVSVLLYAHAPRY